MALSPVLESSSFQPSLRVTLVWVLDLQSSETRAKMSTYSGVPPELTQLTNTQWFRLEDSLVLVLPLPVGCFSSVFLSTGRTTDVALGPHKKPHPSAHHKTPRIARDIELSVFSLIEYAAQHVDQLSCLFVKFHITHYFPRRMTV